MRRQTAFFSPLDSQKGATSEERADDYVCVNRARADRGRSDALRDLTEIVRFEIIRTR